MVASHVVIAQTLERLAAIAHKEFADRPETRSLALLFAMYWADGADDEIHTKCIASSRATPSWPRHTNAEDEEYEGLAIPGEDHAFDSPRIVAEDVDDYDEEATRVWRPYCREDGSQEEHHGHNYAPFAIARRMPGGEVAIERVGTLTNPYAALRDDRDEAEDEDEEVAAWGDARALELFAEIAAHPDDDEPRKILADYWIEQADPRGEALAHVLAGQASLVQELRRWIAPIDQVVPLSSVEFARGFPVRVAIGSLDGVEGIADARAWATIEHVDTSGEELVLPAMTNVRSIGPLSRARIVELAAAPRPWRIEHLMLRVTDGDDAAACFAILRDATTLPALRRIDLIDLISPSQLAALPRVPGVTHLTVSGVPDGQLATWASVRAARALAELTIDNGGWAVTLSDRETIDVHQTSWTMLGALDRLVELLAAIAAEHPGARVCLVPSRHWAPDAALATFLRELGAPALCEVRASR